jgi:peptidyl-prolyl cis-trans isomerase B (cyclophilin B)
MPGIKQKVKRQKNIRLKYNLSQIDIFDLKKTAMRIKTTTFLLLICAGSLLSQSTYTFTGKPMFKIEARRLGVSLGSYTVELFPNIAPKHCRSFDSLVSVKFYDTCAFHRVVPGFVIQGGDPNSRHGPVGTWGQGQPTQPKVKAEFSVARHLRGIMSAARLANDVNSYTSQFFVCVANAPNLDGNYSIYGRVTHNMTLVDTIVLQPVVFSTQRPVQKIEMFITRIGSNDTVPATPVLLSPVNATVGLDTNYVQMVWQPASDGIIYDLQVSLDSTFATTNYTATLPYASYGITKPPGYSTFYWRVRVNNGGHFSSWSQTWKFTTAPIIVDETGIKVVAGGHAPLLFPNPVTGILNLNGLENGDLVVICDIHGRQVRDVRAQGKNLAIDLQGIARGNYVLKISGKGKLPSSKQLIIE